MKSSFNLFKRNIKIFKKLFKKFVFKIKKKIITYKL